jgi:peptidoglycan/LPS O-acetylase OafA/YrhL
MTLEATTADKNLAGYDTRMSSEARTRTGAPRAPALHIPSLDGLRAISFLIVFLAHAGISAMPGGFGVTVFFFLSGYLITTLMRQEVEQTGTVLFGQFYLRRVLRILPPFYAVLGAATLLTLLGVLPGQLELSSVLSQALHYSNYFFAEHGFNGIARGTSVYWSLAVEEHFYFVFPALFLALYRLGVRGRHMAIAIWAICAGVLAWRCLLVLGLDAAAHRVQIATDSRADSMLLGCALAVWNNPALDGLEQPLSSRWLRLFLPAGVLLLLVTFVVRSDVFRETVRYTLQGIALYPIFRTAIRRPDWGPYRLLNHPLLKRIGVLSYSLYLVHHTVLEGLWSFLPASIALRVVVAFALSLALAQAIYVLIETPCARLRKRLHATT